MKSTAAMLCGWENAPADGVPFKSRDGYAYEIKWDGYRFAAIKRGDEVRLFFGRGGADQTAAFPEIVEAIKRIPVDCELDGEAVVLRNGWPSFQDFQNRMGLSKERRAADLRFVVFDVLQFGDVDAKSAPYSERRKALEALVAPAAPTLWVGPSSTDGQAMWDFVVEHQLEGLIAKPLGSRYLPGERGTWIKIKRLITEEFVVIGYTPGGGRRADTFAALIVAEKDGDGLRANGTVGTGFTDKELARLMVEMEPLRRDTPTELLTQKVGAKNVIWLEPVIIGRVTYAERTDGNTLRGPASWQGQVPSRA